MNRVELLMDSNIYFRFARSVHPLLPGDYEVDSKIYTLSVIKDLQKEYEASERLESKFYWVNQAKYKRNRTQYTITSQLITEEEIDNNIKFIKNYPIRSASDVDIRALAIAELLKLIMLTDDADMGTIGKDINVEVWGSIDLMAIMLESGRYDLDKLKAIIAYWKHENDLPFAKFEALFEEEFC